VPCPPQLVHQPLSECNSAESRILARGKSCFLFLRAAWSHYKEVARLQQCLTRNSTINCAAMLLEQSLLNVMLTRIGPCKWAKPQLCLCSQVQVCLCTQVQAAAADKER